MFFVTSMNWIVVISNGGQQTLDTATLLNAFLETPDDYRVDFYRIGER